MVESVRFTSRVGLEHRPTLEKLLFFNSCQSRFARQIVDTIDKYGPPEIEPEDGLLRIRVSGLSEVQSLFALDGETGRLIGVAIYVRADISHVTVLHIGLSEPYCAGGNREGLNLLLRLMKAIRRSSRRMKGVRGLRVLYGSPRANV